MDMVEVGKTYSLVIAQQTSSMHISRLGILIAIFGLLFIVLIARKISGRGWVVLLGGGFLMVTTFLFLGLFTTYSFTRAPAQLAEVQKNPTHRADIPHVSTEAMREHFNRNRIDLEGSEEAKPKEVVGQEIAVGDSPTKPIKIKKPADKDQSQQVRPEWVDLRPTRVGNVYRIVVSSDRYRDAEECYRALEPEFRAVVMKRIKQLTGVNDLPGSDQLGLRMDYILSDICRSPDWIEQTEASFGEMQRVHVLMEFDAAVDKRLREIYRDYQRQFRITAVGLNALLGIGGLALLYGLLQLDTFTRGYYTKRLFFGVPAVIIALVALLVS